jgi:GAF domain-containing protein
MNATDLLTPILEVTRVLGERPPIHTALNLITRRIGETLGTQGCFIKGKAHQGNNPELMSSYAVKEGILFCQPEIPSQSILSRVPPEIVAVPDLRVRRHIDEAQCMIDEGILAVAVVPIEIQHHLTAMVVLLSSEVRDFTADELAFAEIMASRIICMIMWQGEVDDLVEHERELMRTFHEVSSTVNSSLSLKEVLEFVTTKTSQFMGLLGMQILLLASETQKLEVTHFHGLSQRFINKGPVDPAISMPETLRGEVAVIDDVPNDPRIQYPKETYGEGIRKILSVPLMVRGKIIGAVRMYTGERPPFTKREIEFAKAISHQSAIAIENARVYQRVKDQYQQLLTDFGYDGSSR